jgi:hypothetical protein
VRSKSVLWQKERLLNLAIQWLPRSCKFVSWQDCDLVFLNPQWAQETAQLLQSGINVVQLFQNCIRLPKDYSYVYTRGNVCKSFAEITPKNTSVLYAGRFDSHGHTGYAWAARRDILDEYGLYEYAIAGSGDHYIAHACYGDFDGPCICMMMVKDPILMNHFRDWALPFSESVQGRVSVVHGDVLHLWHGDLENRQYLSRHREMARHNFDPYHDLINAPGKPMEWRHGIQKQGLIDMFAHTFFASRKEDGDLAIVA